MYSCLSLGHRTYIGYVYFEYTQTNPVLRVFVELLQKSVAKQHVVKWTDQSVEQQRNGHINGKGLLSCCDEWV